MMKVCNVLFFLLLGSTSCQPQHNWEGSRINKVGVYKNNHLKIIASELDYQIDYIVLDSKGVTLIISDNKFSSFQRWALHLDGDENLWVFSSDIGDACWKKDSVYGKYIKHEFTKLLSKDDLSPEVWYTLKEFHPYSSKNK